jgi:hypothetical protein
MALGRVSIWVLMASTINIIPSMLHTRLHLQGYTLQKDKLVTPGHLATKLTLFPKSESINGEK